MKILLLALTFITLALTTSAFAQQVISKTCTVKSLTSASPENLRIGDKVSMLLNYVNVDGKESRALSQVTINDHKVSGYLTYDKSQGAFPDNFIMSRNNRMLLEVQISNSGTNARLLSLHLSSLSGGWPVIASLKCVND